MKKLFLFSAFLVGLWLAVFTFKIFNMGGEYQSIIVNFKDDIALTQLEESLNQISLKVNDTPTLNSSFSGDRNVYVLEGNKETLKTLRRSGLREKIEYIEPNYIYHTLDIPNDPDYSKQWNLRAINLERAWADSKGEGVTVAVIDTGVSRVPDLEQTEFVEGYDFVNDRTEALDDVGHGTHVAGTIAQSTNNNYGVAGIAYKAKIMPLKVLGFGGGTVADIAEAIRFAADNGADVINMSLGGGGDSHLMRDAIDYAHKKGVVIIAAAGNENDNSASYPARYPKVISVSALDAIGEKAPYSNFGAGIDISAPGGSEKGLIIQETITGNNQQPSFEGFQGTSMAAPHVAGVAALIKATGIKDPEEVRQILIESAREVAEDPFNHYGAGRLDAGGAVQLALKGKITVKDFLRWLRDSGYLNPGFWIDGGTIMLLPKLGMVVGSYLLAWFIRNYLVFNMSLASGMVFGSSGLFILQGLYIFDLPQWPLRLMGSSLPELGNVVMGTNSLNPIFASALIPFILIALFLGHNTLKWVAIGSCLGVASCLGISAFSHPHVWGLGTGMMAQGFLVINALICFGLAYLASKNDQVVT
ncbi:peptidase S8 [Cyanobacterium stanieri LEGE 03274]|uniref:Peptidase S8 n=1 Tax=Cyanobacterium stanieri LEGE 03274 TaxID=1828756 RepID=A0ABR9V586_9CHRO|nr:S8 family peptidase [Cyanobacterium stanieri]MBE9223053.1 peptidase S8 [Cyanobacterium stanieri LEGE 03274]